MPGHGRQVLLAGDGGKVPVNLISSVPLTNLSMTVFAPSDRLTNLSLEPIVPEICESTLTPALSHPMGEGDFFDLSLSTCPGQWMTGTQQVAWLHFQAVSNQTSSFVTLSLDDIVGYRLDGTEARNFAPQSGRLVIIGEEHLLEAMYDTNGVPMLMFYGKTDHDCVLKQSPQTGAWAQWTPPSAFTMTNLGQPGHHACDPPAAVLQGQAAAAASGGDRGPWAGSGERRLTHPKLDFRVDGGA